MNGDILHIPNVLLIFHKNYFKIQVWQKMYNFYIRDRQCYVLVKIWYDLKSLFVFIYISAINISVQDRDWISGFPKAAYIIAILCYGGFTIAVIVSGI